MVCTAILADVAGENVCGENRREMLDFFFMQLNTNCHSGVRDVGNKSLRCLMRDTDEKCE